MARSRPSKKSAKKRTSNGAGASSRKKMTEDPAVLFDQATELLQTGQPDAALSTASRAFELATTGSSSALIGLGVLGEIYVELGDIDAAREHFTRAVALDPNGEKPESEGGGAEKFLWLAQLSEEGGMDSVRWYERGVSVLRRNIQSMEQGSKSENDDLLKEERKKLAHALCAVVEIYMTDLSWEDDAESRCEALVTEALLVAPESAECFQTLASVRISQLRQDDARAALSRSLELWKDLPPESPLIPDFPTQVSLARLLMEVQMENEALDVLERMVLEDDQSVETWYLGGWCLYLIAGKIQSSKQSGLNESEAEQLQSTLRSSRRWLRQSVKLYGLLEYEDEKLKEHASELIQEIQNELGIPEEESDQGEGEDEDEWEDEADEDDDSDEDENMAGT